MWWPHMLHEPSTTNLLSCPPGHALLLLVARPHRSLPICGEGMIPKTLIGSQKVFPYAPTPHRPRGPARPATTSGHGTLGDTQGVPRHTDHNFSSDVTPGNVRRCAKWLVHCLVMLHLLFVCTRISRERRAERQELCSPDPLRILTSGQPWGHSRRINFGEMGSLFNSTNVVLKTTPKLIRPALV